MLNVLRCESISMYRNYVTDDVTEQVFLILSNGQIVETSRKHRMFTPR